MSDFEWNDAPLIRQIQAITKKVLREEAVLGVAQIRRRFSSNGPSRPGRAPAIVTGALSRAVRGFTTGNDTVTLTVAPGQRQKARALESGAPSRNLRPRPFMQPQLPISTKRITKKLTKRLRKFGIG